MNEKPYLMPSVLAVAAIIDTPFLRINISLVRVIVKFFGTALCNATVGDITVLNGTKVIHSSQQGAAIGSGHTGRVTGKIYYSSSIEVDATNCYVHPEDAAHPGIGRGLAGYAEVGDFQLIDDSVEYTEFIELVVTNTTSRFSPLWIHDGTHAGERIHIYINNMQTYALKSSVDEEQLNLLSSSAEKPGEFQDLVNKLKDMKLDDAKITTVEDAKVALHLTESALQYAVNEAAMTNAYLQRLVHTDLNVTTMGENIQGAESTVSRADMVREMVNYTKYKVLSESSRAMLAQSNKNGEMALNLLQGKDV